MFLLFSLVPFYIYFLLFIGLFPIAYAVVDAESEDNWTWFCENLRHILSNVREVTFVSDRNLGLLRAVGKVFPTSYHGFCLNHLKVNLREKFAGHHKALREELLIHLRIVHML